MVVFYIEKQMVVLMAYSKNKWFIVKTHGGIGGILWTYHGICRY